MKNALFLQNLLTNSGYKTLAAGGFVRDFLLNRPYKDIDLATEANPIEMTQVLTVENNIHIIPTGVEHGTITAVIDDKHYEITTLRVDKKCDGRHAEVEFTKSFEEDAKRRDFTINALFMDLNTKRIYDYVNGRVDLESKILRFVGSPEQRIKEDFLRVLRLYRFQATLGFDIHGPDDCYATIYLPWLCFISAERIRDELFKLIVGDFVAEVNHNAFLAILPELCPSISFEQNCKHHYLDVFDHTMEGVKYLAQFKDPILSLAHLLHDVAKPYCHSKDENGIDHFYSHEEESARVAHSICDRLKISNNDRGQITFLIENHMKLHLTATDKNIRKLVNACNKLDSYTIYRLKRMLIADYKGMKEQFWPECETMIERVKEAMKFVSENSSNGTVEIPLNGIDLLDMGIPQGKQIGEAKKMLSEAVLNGNLTPTDKKEAVHLVERWLSKDTALKIP